MFESDLGGPHDGALLFDIVHHLSGEQIAAVLMRIRAALKPGGTIAILDMFRGPPGRQRASAAAGGLFFHLTSGADLPDPAELARLLERAGFDRPRRTKIRRIPDQDLYQATAV
jgi:SAM-dependent methyltransferase